MKWEEALEIWGIKKIKLLSTATNGLESEKHRLLGVFLKDTTDPEISVSLHKTTGLELMQSEKYHMISSSLMDLRGLSTEAFKKELEEQLEGVDVIFTYNLPFQYSFLQALYEGEFPYKLYDLLQVEKALRQKYAFDEEQMAIFPSFHATCCMEISPTSVVKTCKHLGISKVPAPGQLPAVKMLDVLQQIYSSVSSSDIQLFQS